MRETTAGFARWEKGGSGDFVAGKDAAVGARKWLWFLGWELGNVSRTGKLLVSLFPAK